MDNGIRFLIRLVLNLSNRLRTTLESESEGRGHNVVALVATICDRVEADVAGISAVLPVTDPAEIPVRERQLLRLKQQLGTAHQIAAHYQGDSGRQDLPVGLLHLVDELVRDLLPIKADPVIHLDVDNMYSTLPVLNVVSSLLRGLRPPDPAPVAFNLPALDPANALLAPILAHEVGHTAWRQQLQATLDASADLAGASDRLREAANKSGASPADVAKRFDAWRQELFCDALAGALTGPSFLLASAVFLPAPATGRLGGRHPYPRDRLALTLRQLDRHGWLPILERLVPDTLGWCQNLASSPRLTGSELESGLRQACEILEPDILAVAEQAAGNRLLPDQFEDAEQELFSFLDLEIPPARLSGGYSSPWLILAGAWLYELAERGDTPDAAAAIVSDEKLSRFLVKSFELAGVGTLWSAE